MAADFRPRDPLACCWLAIVARPKIVYNLVFNTIITIGGFAVRPAGCAAWDLSLRWGVDGGKIAQTGKGASAEIPRGRNACARTRDSHDHWQAHRGRHCSRAAAAAGAPDRAGSLRPVSDPSRRCPACAFRTGEEGS